MKDTFLFKSELLSCDPEPRVLLLLSGGKDSVCCLYLLHEIRKIKLEAVFFKHKWGSEISHKEAIRHCLNLNIPLLEIDYTEELCKKISKFKFGRPCLTCKPIMYRLAIDYALNHGFSWIATGDNANDQTTISRLQKTNYIMGETRFYCSHYLANEQGINVPKEISIVRPLLNATSQEIRTFLNEHKILVNQNGSTGDKYFEYSREGCCLQFCDPGTELTPEVCNDLFHYNEIANQWGREHNVRTSVHLPSKFVVTIPEGFELGVCQRLAEKGLSVDLRRNSNMLEKKYCSIVVENYPDLHHDGKIFHFLISRLADRLSLPLQENCCQNLCIIGDSQITILATLIQNTLVLNLQFTLPTSEIDTICGKIKLLCIEIFHTRTIEILSAQSHQ